MSEKQIDLVTKHEAMQMLSEILRREDLKHTTFAKALTLYSRLAEWDEEGGAQ
jgi:hypothetical protein